MLFRLSEHLSQGSYQHRQLTILSYYHTQSQQETPSIALLRVRIKAAQNGFSYEGTMIYNFLTRDIHIQENGNLFLKRLQNFNF